MDAAGVNTASEPAPVAGAHIGGNRPNAAKSAATLHFSGLAWPAASIPLF